MILSCFNLRREIVNLGGDGSDGLHLVELLAGAGERDGGDISQSDTVLLSALSKPMLGAVLGIEADTAVAVMYQKQHASRV